MDREAYDEIGDDDRSPAPPSRYAAASVLALAAFVLAVASLLGFGLLNGSSFIAPAFDDVGPQDQTAVLSGLLGAALALLPVGLGLRAVAVLDDDDPDWTATLARAAVVVAGASIALRLAVTLVQATTDSAVFVRF